MAIVIYKDPSVLNTLSIILSIVALVSKSIVFCYSTDVYAMICNWLCICADTFGLFAVLAWVFYVPDDDGYAKDIFTFRTFERL